MNTVKKVTTKQQSKEVKSEVARFIANQIDMCGHSQKEIAEYIGYDKPNIITMFKQGLTRLPINKVKPMAEILGVDPIRMMKMVLTEYSPETWDAIQDVVGFAATENERYIIELLREATDDTDPKPNKTESQALKKAFKELI